jgi:glucokinase
MESEQIPVLELGGTHVTAVLVATGTWELVPGSFSRCQVDADAAADTLLDTFAAAANSLGAAHGEEWVVALPGPFDYAGGIALFRGVAKFDSLHGVDVRQGLTTRLSPRPSRIRFLNDADAFGVGEYAAGAARGHERAVCLTLGTGVGSAFLDRGVPVNSGPTVPPEGSMYLVRHQGRPLEDVVSRRAIRAAYATAAAVTSGALAPDVHTIAQLARLGDPLAGQVMHQAFSALGSALTPVLDRFGASVLVVGGSMVGSWDVLEPALRDGLARGGSQRAGLTIRPAEHPVGAALVGAAYWACSQPD